ncbi:unnamed protein product [Closterium sp. Naga37s-1]|nr:unnamed protein product [Closterium sp. Naga37s-1]
MALSASPFQGDLSLNAWDFAARCDWSRWHEFWVDERAVPLTHPDSNYLLAHTHWLSKVPIPSAHIHTLDDSLPVEAAAEAYEREMARCVEAGVLPMHPVEAAAAEAYELELRQCVEAGVLLIHPDRVAHPASPARHALSVTLS